MNNLENATEEYRLLAVDAAKKRSAADKLEEHKKIVFAELVNQFRKTESAISGAEYKARASDAYKTIIEQYTGARTLANIALAELKSKEVMFEAWRTRESTKRAEMTMR
jgi:hypothetical protein